MTEEPTPPDRPEDRPADGPEVAPATGHTVIQSYLRLLDSSPGVYRMLNAKSEVP